MSGPRMVNAVIAHTDGRLSERPILDELGALQALVGGFVEHVPLGAGAGAFVNESGLFDGLARNEVATRVVDLLRPELGLAAPGYGLRGDVVFVGGVTPAGYYRGCPRRVVDMLRAAAAGVAP